MQEVREAFREFDQVASKYSDYGACDSEPRYVMRRVLRVHLGLEESKRPDWWPTTGEDWQLYTSNMPCGKAARGLSSGLKKLFKKLKKLYFNAEARETIKSYLNSW